MLSQTLNVLNNEAEGFLHFLSHFRSEAGGCRLKERGPLYPEIFMRNRQTRGGFCTFDKGVSKTAITSDFHGYLTFTEHLAGFKGSHQRGCSYRLESTQGSLAPSPLQAVLEPPASQSVNLSERQSPHE